MAKQLWFSRLFIGLVTAWNIQAAISFLLYPASFYPSFELSGVPGSAAVRGIAVLFLMWNIPYLLAVWHPKKHLTSLVEAIFMQITGVLGESAIFLSLPAHHDILKNSILRFIWFDAAGVIALSIAYYLVKTKAQPE